MESKLILRTTARYHKVGLLKCIEQHILPILNVTTYISWKSMKTWYQIYSFILVLFLP